MRHCLRNIVTTVFLIAMASTAFAEVVTIDVTVKAIDAKERSITVTKTTKSKSKDIELEVGKKAKISVGGKDAALDAVKAGQKASVSYETELEVITKIEVAGDGSPSPDPIKSESATFKKTGCRVVWTISETGDSTLTISRPLEKQEAAKESLIRHEDGIVEFQHDFETAESVDKALMGAGENVEFDKTRKALVMTPKTGKDYEGRRAMFSYSKLTQLPVTLEFDIEDAGSNGEFTLFVSIPKRGTENVEFPFLNLGSKDKFQTKAILSLNWIAGRDAKGVPQTEKLLEEQTVELGEPKEFNFTIPLKKSDQRHILNVGVRGAAPVSLQRLAIRGRLVPTMGIGLAEKNGGVIAEKVIPKGLGETVGIKPADVLMSINGNKPKSMKDTMEYLGKIQFGEESEIVVKRNGKTVKIGFTAE